MEIRQLTDAAEKQAVTRLILEALPEWFGIPEAREAYIRESAGRIFFCAYDRNRPVGFLYLKETGNATVELYVMGVPEGVSPPRHRPPAVPAGQGRRRRGRVRLYAGENRADGEI